MTTNCQECGAEMQTYPSRAKRNKGQFCSRACYAKALSKRMAGTEHPMYGKRHRPESIAKMKAAKAEDTRRGPDNPNFKGSWMSNGYRYLSFQALTDEQKTLALSMLPSGHNGIPEHRLIMATIMGRPLASSECVHHRNGVTSDNRPENLALTDNSDHKKTHRAILADLRAQRRENEILRTMLFALCAETSPTAG